MRKKPEKSDKATITSGKTYTTAKSCFDETMENNDYRTDLSDFTFLMPLRIDSTERKENVDTVITFMFDYFKTSFIVLESDSYRKYYKENEPIGFRYIFIEDTNEIFYKTKLINRLIAMADTPYVAIWDADAIAPTEQIINSVEMLRSKQAIMSFPFDGRFYSCDVVSYRLFKRFLDIEILINRIPIMGLMHGYHCPGGAFMINKEKYVEAGGENEYIVGWGPEDFEHVKRMEVLNLPVHYSKGPLFHLPHPRGKNSYFANLDTQIQNRIEFLKTCSISNFK